MARPRVPPIILAIVLFYVVFVTADEEPSPQKNKETYQVKHPICAERNDNLGEALSQYNHCLASKARSEFLICITCVNQMNRLKKSLFNWSQPIDEKVKTGCRDSFVNRTELLIFVEMQEAALGSQSSWVKANCDYCYKNLDSTKPLRKTTKKVLELSKLHEKCLEENFKYSIGLNGEKVYDEVANKSDCLLCNETFVELNWYFDEEVRPNQKNTSRRTCFDLVDAMNNTNRVWRNQLRCFRNYKYEFWVVFGLLVGVLIPWWISVYTRELIAQKLRPITPAWLEAYFEKNGWYYNPVNVEIGHNNLIQNLENPERVDGLRRPKFVPHAEALAREHARKVIKQKDARRKKNGFI